MCVSGKHTLHIMSFPGNGLEFSLRVALIIRGDVRTHVRDGGGVGKENVSDYVY